MEQSSWVFQVVWLVPNQFHASLHQSRAWDHGRHRFYLGYHEELNCTSSSCEFPSRVLQMVAEIVNFPWNWFMYICYIRTQKLLDQCSLCGKVKNSLSPKEFRQTNFLVFSLVKTFLSRNLCQKKCDSKFP